MMRHAPLFALVVALVAGGVACAQAPAKLPDWGDAWMPNIKDQRAQEAGNPAPWTPDAARRMQVLADEEKAGRPHGLFTNCLPHAMPSWMLMSHDEMEILFSPGRVTLLGAADGNRIRRIYTDGRKHPADPDPTFHGHSVGHWEGETLVVDTVAILPETLIAISEAIGIPNDGDMHIVERIHLVSPDVLADDLTITAPHVFTAPWKTTRLFDRKKGALAEVTEGVCRQGDFTEEKDKDGHAIFAPVRQRDGNNLPTAQ